MSDINQQNLDQLLSALAEQLGATGNIADIVVVGGSALVALGLVDRATRDVDVVALREGDRLLSADPLPAELVAARDRVSRDFGLADDWLNSGPAGLVDLGLPDGFIERVETRRYGRALTVRFASRVDQIHLKLYALVDQGPGRHETDLRALSPSDEELLEAARWSRRHDPSPGFKSLLEQLLDHLEVSHEDLDA